MSLNEQFVVYHLHFIAIAPPQSRQHGVRFNDSLTTPLISKLLVRPVVSARGSSTKVAGIPSLAYKPIKVTFLQVMQKTTQLCETLVSWESTHVLTLNV